MTIPILITLFVMYAIVRTFAAYKARSIKLTSTLIWVGLWLSMVVVIVQPEVANRIADVVGVGRGADVIVYVAIVVMAYMLYRLFVRIEQLERSITILTRAQALKDADSNNRSDTHR